MRAVTSRAVSAQRGFSLVAAIFVLVVLAVLAAAMVTIGTVQRSTVSSAIQSARAYQAASAGVEWAIANAMSGAAGKAATCGNAVSTPTINNFSLNVPGLDGFQLRVTCEYTDHQERSVNFSVYAITSAATFGAFGAADYFSRTLTVSVTDMP